MANWNFEKLNTKSALLVKKYFDSGEYDKILNIYLDSQVIDCFSCGTDIKAVKEWTIYAIENELI